MSALYEALPWTTRAEVAEKWHIFHTHAHKPGDTVVVRHFLTPSRSSSHSFTLIDTRAHSFTLVHTRAHSCHNIFCNMDVVAVVGWLESAIVGSMLLATLVISLCTKSTEPFLIFAFACPILYVSFDAHWVMYLCIPCLVLNWQLIVRCVRFVASTVAKVPLFFCRYNGAIMAAVCLYVMCTVLCKSLSFSRLLINTAFSQLLVCGVATNSAKTCLAASACVAIDAWLRGVYFPNVMFYSCLGWCFFFMQIIASMYFAETSQGMPMDDYF